MAAKHASSGELFDLRAMRVHYFQHVAFEGLGSIAAWLTAYGVEFKGTRFDKAMDLPDLADVDWLVVLGGPMSANDEHRYAWLSIHLARSVACENQAFQMGARVIGLQFHLETTPESARALVAHGRDDLRPATYVQSDQAILSVPDGHYSAANALMNAVLLYLAESEG